MNQLLKSETLIAIDRQESSEEFTYVVQKHERTEIGEMKKRGCGAVEAVCRRVGTRASNCLALVAAVPNVVVSLAKNRI